MSQLHRCPSRGVGRAGSLLALAVMLALQFSVAAPGAQAAPKTTNLTGVVPTIQSITLSGNQLLASGYVTAIVHGKTYTQSFAGVPVNISLAADQSGAMAAGCPILDLSLAPIDLNLLGLRVQTSPICLTITAYSGGGLLGNLLCSIANGLSLNVPIGTILSGLSPADLNTLIGGLTGLLNGALQQLLQSVLASITPGTTQHTCAILNLALGPVDLTLLGLNVHLDNCMGGPVTVTITGVTGKNNLLGNLLCQLLAGGQLQLGTTLQNILNLLTGLLNL